MREQVVTSPDRNRWQVRRRWMDRPVPNPWRSWRRNQKKIADLDGVLDPVSFVDFGESITVTIAVAVVAVLIVFVLLPLLGVAFEPPDRLSEDSERLPHRPVASRG